MEECAAYGTSCLPFILLLFELLQGSLASSSLLFYLSLVLNNFRIYDVQLRLQVLLFLVQSNSTCEIIDPISRSFSWRR